MRGMREMYFSTRSKNVAGVLQRYPGLRFMLVPLWDARIGFLGPRPAVLVYRAKPISRGPISRQNPLSYGEIFIFRSEFLTSQVIARRLHLTRLVAFAGCSVCAMLRYPAQLSYVF